MKTVTYPVYEKSECQVKGDDSDHSWDYVRSNGGLLNIIKFIGLVDFTTSRVLKFFTASGFFYFYSLRLALTPRGPISNTVGRDTLDPFFT